MLVEDGKVGSDKTCSDINVIEFLVGEGKGGSSGRAVTVFDDALGEL